MVTMVFPAVVPAGDYWIGLHGSDATSGSGPIQFRGATFNSSLVPFPGSPLINTSTGGWRWNSGPQVPPDTLGPGISSASTWQLFARAA